MGNETVRGAPISNPFEGLRSWLAKNIVLLPLWSEINAISNIVALPIKMLAVACLRKWPAIERLEWMFEAQSLTSRAPVAIAIPLLIAIWRGYRTTSLGHIGTDTSLYPFIVGLSSFNPFLAVCCAIAFGTADFVQKLVLNDMYGTGGRFDYWGAMIGYVISYSAVVCAGVAPGITARLCRRAFVLVIARAWRADGAAEQPHSPSIGEDLAAMAGSYSGGYLTMQYVAPPLEMPAFYLRPHPDVSCFASEAAGLRGMSRDVGLFASLGSILGPNGRGNTFASMGLDLLPGIGTLKGFVQAFTGQDLVTGAKLALWERALGLLPFARGASLAGREMLGALRGLSRVELGALARVLDGVGHRGPLERAFPEIGAQVQRMPELQTIMEKLQAVRMEELSRGLRSHRLGDVFELRAAIQEMLSTGRGIRQFQDTVLDKNGILRNGADIVTQNGDLIQLKNYGGKGWMANLEKAIFKQADSDFLRYGLNDWADSAGQKLSGTFEFQFNARRLLNEGVPLETIQQFAHDMAKALRDKWAQYGVFHDVKPSF